MKKMLIFFWVGLLAVVGCTSADQSATVDIATVQASVDEIWSNGNMDVVDQVYSETFVRHNPSSGDPPVTEGREAFKEMMANTREQFSGLKVESIEIVSQGNMSASRWRASATHKETGNHVTFEGQSFSHTNAEGQITEQWVSFDTQSVTQQIQGEAAETSMK